MNRLPKLYIIIPCYNEEEVLPHMMPVFDSEIRKMIMSSMVSNDSRILYVDDGSVDNTHHILTSFHRNNPFTKIIRLHKNSGQQNALACGLKKAYDEKCDITITIDCDGQDPLWLLKDMVKDYLEKRVDIVYTARNDRNCDSFFKRITAHTYYKVLNLLGCKIIYDSADCRLISRKALSMFVKKYKKNTTLRIFFPKLNLPYSVIYFRREKRDCGTTKYSLYKMLKLAFLSIFEAVKS